MSIGAAATDFRFPDRAPASRVAELEAALREAEARFQDYLDISSDWIWEMDESLRFSFFSGRLQEVSGQSPERLLGKTRRDLMRDPGEPAMRRHLADLDARRPFRDFVYEVMTPHGRRHFSISGKPIIGADGVFRGYRGTGRDATDEIEARRRAERIQARFVEAIEHIPASLMLFDDEDRLVVCNSVTRQYFPRVAHLLVPGTRCEDLYRAQADSGLVLQAVGNVEAWLAERMRWHRDPQGVITRHFDDGRWVQIIERRTSDGGTIGIRVDVTALKEKERELAEHARELERSNTELEQFAYVASHDLQEPLRMVGSYCQLLQRRYKGKLDADADDFIGFAVEGASRMQRMINDLLTYSRVGRKGNGFERLAGGDVVAAALRNLEAAISEAKATVEVGDLPAIVGERTQLVQLFQNLVGNAIKFRGEAPPMIRIAARRDGDKWCFSVADNGIGIAPEYADRIFLIFQRLHERGKYPGTGIGLAICKKVVEHHGGRIWVEAAAGQGSTFHFTLPEAADAQGAEHA